MRWTLLPWLILGLVAYELIRWRMLRAARSWFQDGALRFTREHRVRLESSRFLDRLWLREALMADAAIEQAATASALTRGEPLRRVLQRVEGWATEMAPAFSLSTYYRLGGGLSGAAVNLAYDLHFDRSSYDRAVAAVPAGAIPVFVINHRSNADYIVLSYALLRRVALSYAVGEWARVWPLDVLFRAFGSFFIRRGEKDRLYHKVLERFVQLLVGHGGTTGFFIEGGLSRDGALRPPKAGLLDYIVGIRREQPDREIVFIPVGINFDRVLEDSALIAEGTGAKAPGLLARLKSLLGVLLRLPVLLGAGLLRPIIGRRPGGWATTRLGSAAVCVGPPAKLADWPGGLELAELPEEERRPEMKKFAAFLLGRVGETVPVTPVPLLCLALLGDSARERSALVAAIRALIDELRRSGAPVMIGLEASHGHSTHIDGLDEAMDAVEEAERVVVTALSLLRRRRLLHLRDGKVLVPVSSLPILRYYARSISHHLGQVIAD